MAEPKILIFDVETLGGMNASYGQVENFGWKWYSPDLKNPVYSKDLRDYELYKTEPWNSLPMLHDLLKLIEEADMVVSFYGKGYDWKLVQTVLLKERITLPPTPHVDLYFIGRSNQLIGRGSLDAALTYHELEVQKFHLPPGVWRKAMHGHEPSMDLLKQRVEADVQGTEMLYDLWRPLVRQHPRLKEGTQKCRVCGGNSYQHRGYSYSLGGVKRSRVQCTNCGAWSTLPEPELVTV